VAAISFPVAMQSQKYGSGDEIRLRIGMLDERNKYHFHGSFLGFFYAVLRGPSLFESIQ
jgi:hypothetical protein